MTMLSTFSIQVQRQQCQPRSIPLYYMYSDKCYRDSPGHRNDQLAVIIPDAVIVEW